MLKSRQISKRLAHMRELARPEELGGKVRVYHFDIDVTENAKDFQAAILPAGKCRLLTTLSRISVVKEDKPLEVTLSVGHDGFVSGMRVNTPASVDAIAQSGKVKGMVGIGTYAQISGFPYDSMNEVTITLTAAEEIPAGAEIHGVLFYVCD